MVIKLYAGDIQVKFDTAMMKKLLLELFGPSSAFKPGDSVEPIQGGQLMVVKNTDVDRHTGERIVVCSAFDPVSAISTIKSFKEAELKLIDWYGTAKPGAASGSPAG